MPNQTNREKALIRLLKDIRELQLTTSDLLFLKENIERIYLENKIQEQILKYVYNSQAYQKAVAPKKS